MVRHPVGSPVRSLLHGGDPPANSLIGRTGRRSFPRTGENRRATARRSKLASVRSTPTPAATAKRIASICTALSCNHWASLRTLLPGWYPARLPLLLNEFHPRLEQ